jgi:heme exporter protein C
VVVHLPAALLTVGFLIAATIQAFRYLGNEDPLVDEKHAALIECTALLGALALGTGIVFSRYQWGDWWHWDPRQTSFLLVMLMLGASLVLRSALTDRARRAKVTAIYSAATLLPNLFLIFVFPRLPQIKEVSLHPSQTVAATVDRSQQGFDSNYQLALLVMLVGAGIATWHLYRTRRCLLTRQRELENLHAELDAHRFDSTGRPVARPVAYASQGSEGPPTNGS